MAFRAPVLASLASITGVLGQYPCPSGSETKSGDQSCTGLDDKSCTVGTCCTAPIVCSSNAGTLLLAYTTGNTICKKNSQWAFYDLKKAAALQATDDDAGFKSACCTDCSAATCAAWPIGLTTTCASTKKKDLTRPLPAKSKCESPTADEYKAACCIPKPVVCSSNAGTLLLAYTAGNTICKKNSQWAFYDLKKAAALQATDDDAGFKSACCTDCSAATCAAWPIGLTTTCASDKLKDLTRSLPAKSKCESPTADEYKAACCVPLKKCSAYDKGGDNDASTTPPTCFPLAGLSMASLAAVLGFHIM